MSKTKSCHCCKGTGKEINHVVIGAELKKLRKASGLSQERVGEKMGYRKPYISELERGRRNWRPDLVHAFKKAINS